MISPNDNSNQKIVSPRSYLCVPFCINMVLQHQGFCRIDEDEIAHSLGLQIPPDRIEDYPYATISSEPIDWGVYVGGKQHEAISKFLQQKDIPIYVQYIPSANISRTSFIELLEENLLQQVSIIVGYDYKTVFHEGLNTKHASVVESVESRADRITLIEPESDLRLTTTETELYRGMRITEGGAWFFSKSADNIVLDSI